MSNIVIGIDKGTYTPNVGTRTITLSGLTGFTPTIEGLLYVYNYTKGDTYFAQAQSYAKEVTITASGADWILEYQALETFEVLGANDIIHIQFWHPTAIPVYNADTGQWENLSSMPSKTCSDNTSVLPLGIDGVFNGDWQDTMDYGTISVGIKADQNSATDGLQILWSSDGVTVSDMDVYTILANKGKVFSFGAARRYLKIIYTNGGVGQTFFDLETSLHRVYIKPSSHRIQDNIVDEDDAELVKAVLTGEDQEGIFKNAKVTRDGYLTIADSSSGLAIAKGDVTGTSFIHKFGNAPDFDTLDGEVTVWDGAEDNTTWENMVYDYSTTADIQYISSSSVSDTLEIEIEGLDANYDLVTQVKTLTGQTSATLDTPLLRVFRMINNNGVDLVGHVFCSTTAAPAGGVPIAANIRAIIQPTNNQTLMAVYTVPLGKTAYMRDWYASTAGANKNSNYSIKLFARPFGGVFQLKHINSISDNGSSYIKHNYTEPEIFEAKTDIELRMAVLAVGATAASASAGFDIVLIDN